MQVFANLQRAARFQFLTVCCVLWATLAWAYWPILYEAAEKWRHDPRYSHGFIVPGFSLALLWVRRDWLKGSPLSPSWWGVPLLLAGAALYLAGAYLYFEWFGLVSLLPALGGICLLSGGRRTLRWSWPALAFLIFMMPLPYRVEIALAGPLQRVATLTSTYALQTLGIAALAEGNVILLDEVRLGIEEACSGLSMLVVFFSLSTAVALLSRRPLWERFVLVLSAIPIAVIANVIRITATGILHGVAGRRWADLVFHDLSGWFMMPVALGLLFLELRLLALLFVEREAAHPLPVSFPATAAEYADGAGPEPAAVAGACTETQPANIFEHCSDGAGVPASLREHS